MDSPQLPSSALTVKTHCPNCGSQNTTNYVLLGSSATCPDCAEPGVMAVRPGTTYPLTGSHVTYGAFYDLLSHADSQTIMANLLQRWFGLRVVGLGLNTQVKSIDDETMDLLKLHCHIQSNEVQRGELYNAAMTIWHS